MTAKQLTGLYPGTFDPVTLGHLDIIKRAVKLVDHLVIGVATNAAKAPKSVDNFLQYVKDGFYDGTIFHRVIPKFMAQGGGWTKDMQHKRTRAPIHNEANNGVSNLRGNWARASFGGGWIEAQHRSCADGARGGQPRQARDPRPERRVPEFQHHGHQPLETRRS